MRKVLFLREAAINVSVAEKRASLDMRFFSLTISSFKHRRCQVLMFLSTCTVVPTDHS